jgi:uncharacterized protein (DUF736 family)
MRGLGTFKPSKQGGWEGRLLTLTLDRKVRLVPNDDRRSEQAPDYIALLGWSRVGEAWKARSRGEAARDYLRVHLHDPTWPAPLKAALFPAPDGATAQLVLSEG